MLFQKQSSSFLFSFNTILLSVFVLLSLSCVTSQKHFDISLFQADDKPWIIAHRGGRALFPENTMAAFDGSAALKVDALEMDVCLTKDGVLITNHDLTIDRTTNGKGKVIDYTFEELQSFNFGYNFKDDLDEFSFRNNEVKVTSFESVLKKYGTEIPLIIELKNKSQNGFLAAKKLVALLEKYNCTKRVIIGSFHDEVLEKFKQLCDNKIMTSTSI